MTQAPYNIDLGPAPEEQILFSRSEIPYGISWESWTIMWWEWLLSIPKIESPAMDFAQKKHSPHTNDDRVVFFAGNLGGISNRSYIVPRREKPFSFPIINFTTSFLEESTLITENDLHRRAGSDINDITKVITSIDSIPIKNVKKFRVHSTVFDIVLKDQNLLDLPAGQTRAISDGYWIFLKPLEPGSHDIQTFGACSLGRTCIKIQYHILVF